MGNRIFLSHAAVDKKLVDAFENMISKSTGVPSSEIFCSSLEGQGVPKGKGFVDHIRSEMTDADVVVALLTPAYIDSAFCMAELGAAWVLGTQRYPVLVPPLGYEAITATQLGLAAVKIDDEEALLQMFEDMNKSLNVATPSFGIIRRSWRTFETAWEDLFKHIAPAQRVDRETFTNLEAKCSKLEEQLKEADDQVIHLEKVNEQLRLAKDKDEVSRIDAENEDPDLEIEYGRLVSAVTGLRNDFGGVEVLKHSIMSYYGRAGRIDWESYPEQFETAMKHGIIDPDTNDLMWSCAELSTLDKSLKRLDNFLLENETAPFLTKEDRRGPEDIRYWEDKV